MMIPSIFVESGNNDGVAVLSGMWYRTATGLDVRQPVVMGTKGCTTPSNILTNGCGQ